MIVRLPKLATRRGEQPVGVHRHRQRVDRGRPGTPRPHARCASARAVRDRPTLRRISGVWTAGSPCRCDSSTARSAGWTAAAMCSAARPTATRRTPCNPLPCSGAHHSRSERSSQKRPSARRPEGVASHRGCPLLDPGCGRATAPSARTNAVSSIAWGRPRLNGLAAGLPLRHRPRRDLQSSANARTLNPAPRATRVPPAPTIAASASAATPTCERLAATVAVHRCRGQHKVLRKFQMRTS